jgi:diaminopimelate decarboxylase
MTGGSLNAILRTVAGDYGTPCYVYFMDDVRERVERVRAAFGKRFRISYAVKSNPNPAILHRLRGVVDALDVSSAGEVLRAVDAGWEPARLSFTGPGKTHAELQASVARRVGEIIVESVDEAELLNGVARAAGKRQRVIIRIAPSRVPRGFGLNMSGKPTPFGIDEEEIDAAVQTIRELSHLELCGFHIYSGTQCLNAEAIAENYGIFIEIFRRVCYRHGVKPERLIFGSGIGIPYYDNEVPVDLAAIAEKTNPALDALKSDSTFSAADLVLEMGRYLIGEAGIYMTRVIRKKHSRGVDLCICDGGMHHHLGAAGHLGTLIQRNYQMFKITEDENAAGAEHAYNLVGPLCTTIDTLGRQVKFTRLDADDLIGIRCSGAYGVTASPIHFISHSPPREIIVDSTGGSVRIEDCSQFEGVRAVTAREAVRQ